jgi:hypothetical protein
MSKIITVSHETKIPTGQIIINSNFQNTEKDKIIETNTFFNLNLNNNKQRDLNNDDNVFMAEQKHLRALDCIKDGSVDPKINGVKDVVYNNFNEFNNNVVDTELIQQNFSLTELEEKFTEKNLSRIKKYSWVKLSKDSNLSPIIEQRIIFKESGLDSSRFIKDPIFCVNFANEIIDPAGRSPRATGDIIFPENNTTLILDESFLSLFGFYNCSVKATRKSDKKYNYIIKIDEIEITGTENGNMTTFNNKSIKKNEKKINQWFEGNRVKNQIINTLIDTNNKQINNQIRKQRIKTFLNVKEMGDVLQVLIMLIWKNYNNNNQMYSISTCDKVVCLLCMILNLNCILTYAEKKPNLRLYSIDVFEATGYSVFDIMNKFNYETENIIKHNQAYIDCISSFDEETAIYISALDTNFYFNKIFYDLLIGDMNTINSELKQYVEKINNEIDIKNTNSKKNDDEINRINIVINNEIEKIKSNFTLNVFFRKSRNKQRDRGENITMILTKNYTKNVFLLKTELNRMKNYNKNFSFFEIAKKINIEFKNAMIGGNSQKSNNANNDKLYDILRFDDENVDEMDVSETKNNEINDEIKDFSIEPLYKELNRNIEEIVNRIGFNNFLIDIKSELYYEFFINNRVEYDENLKIMIMNILKKLGLLLSPIFNNKVVNKSNKTNKTNKSNETKIYKLTKQSKKFNNSLLSKRGKRINYESELRKTKRKDLLISKRNGSTRKKTNSPQQTNNFMVSQANSLAKL